jgi:tRNA acetyltransferase TAN1
VKNDYFENDDKTTDQTVAIITEVRNNIMITKEEIIQTIAPLIPPKYK